MQLLKALHVRLVSECDDWVAFYVNMYNGEGHLHWWYGLPTEMLYCEILLRTIY